jgi:hypothetical protein
MPAALGAVRRVIEWSAIASYCLLTPRHCFSAQRCMNVSWEVSGFGSPLIFGQRCLNVSWVLREAARLAQGLNRLDWH